MKAPAMTPRALTDLRLKHVVVNGYDQAGGLWFSRRTHSERELVEAVGDAWATRGVASVLVDLPNPNRRDDA